MLVQQFTEKKQFDVEGYHDWTASFDGLFQEAISLSWVMTDQTSGVGRGFGREIDGRDKRQFNFATWHFSS